MKILLSLLILCCLVNIFCQELCSSEDNLTTDSYLIEDCPSQDHLVNPLQTLLRIVRRRSPRQFFGLMGKRSSAKAQLTRKRHKFQAFVGLMGKRNLGEQSVPCDLPL